MLYQIYVISKIKLNLEMFQYNVGSQHCQNNRKYPTFRGRFGFLSLTNVSNLAILALV